ncbi:MAG: hypothetical protein JW860_12535 [Sedimentisphaerales bacterium]|nr:hypothetical protein [Sedimentisphaerales bacterium]
MLSWVRNHRLEKNTLRCRCRGYHLMVRCDSFDEGFLEKCCLESKERQDGFIRVKSSPYARIYRFEYHENIYYHKTYLPRSGTERLKDIFQGNRAQRAWRGDLILNDNGFFAPEMVVVGRKGGDNFTVTKMIPGALKFRHYFQNASAIPPDKETIRHRRKTITELGQTIGRLHAQGIVQGDMRLGNIIIDASDTNHFRFVFLDNERTRQYRHLPGRERLKNLVQLNMNRNIPASRTDKLRFINFYLKENPELIPHKKMWIDRIIKKTRHRRALRSNKTICPPEG